jgi:hypothetical protein
LLSVRTTCGRVEKFLAPGGQISYHYMHLLEGCNMERKLNLRPIPFFTTCIEKWGLKNEEQFLGGRIFAVG